MTRPSRGRKDSGCFGRSQTCYSGDVVSPAEVAGFNGFANSYCVSSKYSKPLLVMVKNCFKKAKNAPPSAKITSHKDTISHEPSPRTK
jgi:hypothetical protein